MDLFNTTKCSPPDCKEWLLKNVTTPEHTKLALDVAAESIVLLKNVNGVLPISNRFAQTLAVVGSASTATVLNEDMEDVMFRCVGPVLMTVAIMLSLIAAALLIAKRKGNGKSCFAAAMFAFTVLLVGMNAIAAKVVDTAE